MIYHPNQRVIGKVWEMEEEKPVLRVWPLHVWNHVPAASGVYDDVHGPCYNGGGDS